MDGEIFLGRGRELEQLERLVSKLIDWDNPPSIPQVALISGQGGIGKSTLLRELQFFAGKSRSSLQLLDLDWQDEKQGNPGAFAVTPDQIEGRILFQTLDRLAEARLERWQKHRKAYREILSNVDEVFASALRASSEQLSLSRKSSQVGDVVAETAAAVAAVPAGVFGGVAQPVLARLFRRGLSAAPEFWVLLQGKLKKAQWDLLLAPEPALAAGLARSLADASEDLPILVMFDTYELMDEWDGVVRQLIRESGPRVGWIIAGRHNLYDTRYRPGRGRIDGYREENRHHYDVILLDLRALSREDVRELFRQRAPERPQLSDEETLRVDEATGAIPLALKLAADIWRDTGDLGQILDPQNTPSDSIVQAMVKRYTQYCIDNERDRRSLVALAMADGDAALLKAMLEPEFGGSDEAVRQHLELVRHRYEAVQMEGRSLRLHDEPALFFRQFYQSEEHRNINWIQQFNQRAIKDLCERINRLLAYHLNLRSLCEDPDYVQAAVKAAHFLLWLNPMDAASWITARYVEGIAFSGILQDELLETVQAWRPHLDARWLGRLATLEEVSRFPDRPNALAALRKLLEDDAKRGWLTNRIIQNRFEQERETIRLWFSARAFHRGGQLKESLTILKMAFAHADVELKTQIAWTARELAYDFYLKSDYDLDLQASEIVVGADPSDASAWRELGTSYSLKKEYDKAEECHRKALEINPKDASAWRELGTDYSWKKQYDKAEEYHRKALEINPNDAHAWRELGNDCSFKKQYDKAEEYHRKALGINPNDSEAWRQLGIDYSWRKQYGKAEEYYRKALEINPGNADAWRDSAWSFTYAKQYSEADKAFRKVLENSTEDAGGWDGTGYLHLIRGNLQSARQAFERSISADAHRFNPYSLTACLLYRAHQVREALEWAEKALSVPYITSASPYLVVLGLLLALNLPERPSVSEVAREKLKNEVDKLYWAEWLALGGGHQEALERLSEAIRETPNLAVWARFRPAFHSLRNDPRFWAMTEEAEGSTWQDLDPPQLSDKGIGERQR